MRFLVLIPALCAALPAAAQTRDGFDLSGNFRVRVEGIDVQARAGVPANETSTQTRLILRGDYRTGPLLIAAEVIDSRALDMPHRSAITTNEVDTIEPVQAYVALDLRPGADWTSRVTAGRFTLDLGSRRLIARDDYRNTTNAFTGARLDLAHGAATSATLIYVLPQQRLPDTNADLRSGRVALDHQGFDQRLWGGRLQQALVAGAALDLTAYRFEERDRPGVATRDRQLWTYGARLFRPAKPGRWDFEAELLRQSGTISASTQPAAATLPVKAWMAHGEIGRQWERKWRPRLVAQFDYASGDRRGVSYGRFDTLFGMRRGEFGPAGLYNAVTRTNLVSPGVRLELGPSPRLDMFLTERKLWLASRYDGFASTGTIDPSGRSGTDAGWQTDTRIRWWAIPKRLQLEADATLLAKGRFLRTAPDRGSATDTRYMSLNATIFF